MKNLTDEMNLYSKILEDFGKFNKENKNIKDEEVNIEEDVVKFPDFVNADENINISNLYKPLYAVSGSLGSFIKSPPGQELNNRSPKLFEEMDSLSEHIKMVLKMISEEFNSRTTIKN